MMRRLLQPVWVLLAVIFLIEAWLWDHLEPLVAWVVARIPLQTFKQWLAEPDRLHRAGDPAVSAEAGRALAAHP